MAGEKAVSADLRPCGCPHVSGHCVRVARPSEGNLGPFRGYLVVDDLLCELQGYHLIPLGRVEDLLEAVFGGSDE